MIFGALIIGDEILSGRRQDKHLPYLISALESRGLGLEWVHYIGDEPARIIAEIQAAAIPGQAVFSFGGIGATPDDHTRQCAAQALGLALVLHSQAASLIEQRAAEMAAERGEILDTASPDHERRLRMGVFPAGARIIPNFYNRVPGFSVDNLHFMPGFPIMAHPMLDWLLDEYYLGPVGTNARSLQALRVRGVNESSLIPLLEQIERSFDGVSTFSLPSMDHPTFGAHIELGVKGTDAARVEAAMRMLREGLCVLSVTEIVHAAPDKGA